MKLGLQFLYLAQQGGGQDGVEDVPGRLGDGERLGAGAVGCGAFSPEVVGERQRPTRPEAERQVVGEQILQGSARLNEDSFYLVLRQSQRRPGGSDLSDEVPSLGVRCFG